MKATAGTARAGREAAALSQAVPRRVVAKPSAKAAQAPAKAAQVAVARKTAASPKPAKPGQGKPGQDKSVAQPAKKAAPAAKVPVTKQATPSTVAAKPASGKPVASKPVEAKPVAAKPVVTEVASSVVAKTLPASGPAAPFQATQPKQPPAPLRPASVPAAVAPPPATIAAPERRSMMPDRPPARPMAKAEIFVEGDHVVYPTHGVGKVERIATEEIAGHKLELIHITFEENRMTLRVPVAKARTAGLRKLATRKLFDEALAVLKGRARIKRTMWSRRAQEYEAKINSGDPLSIAEVVRDLHRNAGQPDQSFSERQIYEAAMDRLAAELAALDKTDKLTAVTKLANFLKTV
jgi:CarD family transcriptional regulator